MKALIIAAGKGDRLGLTDKPKSLVQLLGLSLIERVILTAKQAGINEFIVVVGYLGDKIRAELGNGERYGVKIDYIENEEWQRENGVSVLKAKELLKEKFILLMTDHLFEARILNDLKKIKVNGCVLCVDKVPKEYIDLEDATKVKVENDKVVEIGKRLEEYNAIDCGIFLLSPIIFDALEESIEKGDELLSDGIRILAKKGEVRAFDIKDSFWIDIDTRDSFRKAEKMLCDRLIKPTDGPVSKLLNRPISIRISKFLVKTELKPSSISFISFILATLAAFFFCLGNYLSIVIGGLLTQFSSIVDGCDGEVARLKFQESEYGAWFDAVLDRYADALIIFGMVYGHWALYNNALIWVIGFITLIGCFMNSYTADRYEAAFRRGKIRAGVRRDVRLFLIMIGALFNQIFYTLIFLALLTNIESMRRLIILKDNKI
jgi:CDP-L-myo-inositol myo-inositolphosphotransferase